MTKINASFFCSYELYRLKRSNSHPPTKAMAQFQRTAAHRLHPRRIFVIIQGGKNYFVKKPKNTCKKEQNALSLHQKHFWNNYN